jgi:hypothetical protein
MLLWLLWLFQANLSFGGLELRTHLSLIYARSVTGQPQPMIIAMSATLAIIAVLAAG